MEVDLPLYASNLKLTPSRSPVNLAPSTVAGFDRSLGIMREEVVRKYFRSVSRSFSPHNSRSCSKRRQKPNITLSKITKTIEHFPDTIPKFSEKLTNIYSLDKSSKSLTEAQKEYKILMLENEALEKDFSKIKLILSQKDEEIAGLSDVYAEKRKNLANLCREENKYREVLEQEEWDKDRIHEESEKRIKALQRDIEKYQQRKEEILETVRDNQQEYDQLYNLWESEKDMTPAIKERNMVLEEEIDLLRHELIEMKASEKECREKAAFTKYELGTNIPVFVNSAEDFQKAIEKLKDLEEQCDKIAKENLSLKEDQKIKQEEL